MIRILIDADACPVKEETYKVALRHKVAVVVVANDPVNGRDPTGMEVVVDGSKKDVKTFVKQASDLTGLKLKVSKGGVLSVSGKGKGGNAEAASTLSSAISSSNSIKVNAVENDANVFIDSYANNKVDVGDIGAFANQDRNFGAAALTHVISERMDAASNGGSTAANFRGAHSVALGAEARAMGNGAVTRVESVSGAFSGPGAMTIKYLDSSGNVVKTFTVSIGSDGKLQ